ncbi:Uncharacterised protein [Mycobacteroides abscessus]|nr:Uncharacterised protein [Mycobacteroides abscessus]CPW40956.1 Uncharacterised protein [Mycobacteroides abscessus]
MRPRCLPYSMTPQGLRPPGPHSDAGTRLLPAPSAGHAVRAWPGARPPCWVLAPHMRAPRTLVAAHGDYQRGRPPPERLMSQLTGHGVTRAALLAAPTTPAVLVGDPAGQHGPLGCYALPGHLRPQLIEAAERRQIRASEGSVRHVEVFQLGRVRTPIIGRPRPLPRQRRADHLYTLNCEEPPNGGRPGRCPTCSESAGRTASRADSYLRDD